MGAVNVRVLRLMLGVCGGLALLAVGAARGGVPSPDPSPAAGPVPDPFPVVHVHVRPTPAATAPVLQRPVVTTPLSVPRIAKVAPRATRHRPVTHHRARVAARRHVVAAPVLRIPDHAPPAVAGALVTADPRRRIPLVLVLALGGLTLASGALVGTIARAART